MCTMRGRAWATASSQEPRDRAHAVGRDADRHPVVTLHAGGERLDRGEEDVGIGIVEAALAGDRGHAEARPRVADAEKRDAQADLACGGDHPERELEPVLVGAAVGVVVEVVELADGRGAGERHLQEALAGGDLDAVGVEARGGLVHRLAPGPEVVLGAPGGEVLCAAADQALEGVAVGVDQAGKQQAAVESLYLRSGRWGAEGEAAAVGGDLECGAADQAPVPEQRVGLEPAGSGHRGAH